MSAVRFRPEPLKTEACNDAGFCFFMRLWIHCNTIVTMELFFSISPYVLSYFVKKPIHVKITSRILGMKGFSRKKPVKKQENITILFQAKVEKCQLLYIFVTL